MAKARDKAIEPMQFFFPERVANTLLCLAHGGESPYSLAGHADILRSMIHMLELESKSVQRGEIIRDRGKFHQNMLIKQQLSELLELLEKAHKIAETILE